METHLNSIQATEDFARKLAKEAKCGDFFALNGDLGAGKTAFAKFFIKYHYPDASVSSPTFPIVQEYRDGPIDIFHFDLYRLKSADEVIDLGWDEVL